MVLRVIPDDTMRGLELRKGSVDLIVNDLSPDIVWQLQREGRVQVETAPGTDYAYIGLNLADPILSHLEVRKAIGYAIDRDAIVKYLRRGFATTAVGIVPPMSWAFERNVFDFTYDPAQAARLLDAAGFPDPDGDGPLPRFRLSLKTSTTEVYRIQAAAIQQRSGSRRHRARGAVVRSCRRCRPTSCVEISRCTRCSLSASPIRTFCVSSTTRSRSPPAGLNRVRYSNPDVDRLIEGAAAAADDEQRRALYGEAQQRIAQDVPYISLWYKTNVAIFQPGIHGVRLSPIADFTFLRDVYRDVPGAVRVR